jgi:diamine oxidase
VCRYDQQTSAEPLYRFDDWAFDNDTLVNQDLVAWVTVGTMHMPHAEDVPITYSIGTTAS